MTDLSAVYRGFRKKMICYTERRGCYDPEEVVDEALYRAFVKPGFKGKEIPNIEAYLFGVLRNVLREWFRRVAKGVPLEDDPTVPNNITEQRMCENVREAWNSLTEDDRELFEEFCLDRVSAKDLAEKHGLTAEGIRSKIFRIRRHLKLFLGIGVRGSSMLKTNDTFQPY